MGYVEKIRSEIYYTALCVFRVKDNGYYIDAFNQFDNHLWFMLSVSAISQKTYNSLIEEIQYYRRMYDIPYKVVE